MSALEVEPEIELVGPWPAAQVPTAWRAVVEHVDRANARSGGRYSSKATLHALMSGRMQLWTVEKGGRTLSCAITELITYPTGLTVCSLVAVTGQHRHEWTDAWRNIAEWAKGHGALRLESWARPGWSRVMKKDGWKETHRLIEVEI